MWQPRVYQHFRRADLAMVAAHNVWVLPLCWLLARRTGAHLIYNAHELETETAAITGFKQRVAKLIEARFIRRCAMVSVVNEPIADWYEATYRHVARPAWSATCRPWWTRRWGSASASVCATTRCSTSTPVIWSTDGASR